VLTAAALSEHPVPSAAVGECIGELLDRSALLPEPRPPDLVAVFCTAPLVGALDDIVAATTELLHPVTMIGATAVSVLGGAREAEQVGAVSMFALWGARCRTFRSTFDPATGALAIDGLPDQVAPGSTLVVLADPFTSPVDRVLVGLESRHPGVPVAGGCASAANAPGGNRLVLDGVLHRDGAVGVVIESPTEPTTLVAQGCEPIGRPVAVTSVEGNVITSLAGEPALDHVRNLLESLPPETRRRAAAGLHLGVVIDEHRSEFRRGDFLMRGVLGADPDRRAVVVGDAVELGATVQFQVRDAAAADDDLRDALATVDRPVAGTLVFTCNGRGSRLFGHPDHDAALISEATDGAPLAGMFCAGELGPVGGRSHLHGFTAVSVLF
jgi:small ligand-binding sensory domain FIST